MTLIALPVKFSIFNDIAAKVDNPMQDFNFHAIPGQWLQAGIVFSL
jgi:hypothetical protein